MTNARIDENSRQTLTALSSVDGITIVNLWADPVTHRLLTDSTGGVGSGTVTSVSVVTANGISGTVATATTTPAITLSLGAITPSSVNGLTLAAQTTGFTISGGTTPKTLTVALDANVAGTNTGDQNDHGLMTGLADDDHTQYERTCTSQNAINTNYVFLGTEQRNGGYFVDTSGGSKTITLDPDLFATGFQVSICKGSVDKNTVTLDATSGKTINGTRLYVISDLYKVVTLVKDGAGAWKLKSMFDPTGFDRYHGIESHGALSFDNTTHVFTMGAGTNTYWYKGNKYTTSSAITCDLDDYVTLTANTLYFISFDDATGTLKASASAWDWYNNVFVATVFWNGTAGSDLEETHDYRRNIEWHIWAHSTIGCRYISGLSITNPTTTNDALLQIEAGSIADEDHIKNITQQTTMRGWYKASSSVYTFADYSLPYLGTSGQPQYLDTDTYALTNVGASDYVVYWVYASPDITRPIYVFPTTASTAHNTLTVARTETPPNLAGFNINAEMKLIYKFIYKGDGQFQESSDYRLSSPLPSGGTGTITASSVLNTPTGDISSTDVQSAINELDTEKAAIAQTMYIGTTATAINRASAGQTLAGITLTTPDIGTPSAGTLTNCTGLPVAGIVSSTSTALGVGSLDVGHASDTTITRIAAGILGVEGRVLDSYATTATAAGTTTMDITYAITQYFTGTTTQTVKLPTTSVVAGQEYIIRNIGTSTACVVTVQSSGANEIIILGQGGSAVFTALQATPTTAAHWNVRKLTKNFKTATSYTTDTGTSLNCDYYDTFIVTAQAGALKLNNPTGTAVDGQVLFVAVTGTAARAITYDTQFEASTVALPSTTVTTARLNMIFTWRADTSKWVILGTA